MLFSWYYYYIFRNDVFNITLSIEAKLVFTSKCVNIENEMKWIKGLE